MINTRNKKIEEFSEKLHYQIQKKTRNKSINEKIVIENEIFDILCDDPGISPFDLSSKLYDKYDRDLSGEEILNIFRKNIIAKPSDRRDLFKFVSEIVDLFGDAVMGNNKAFTDFEIKRKEKSPKYIKAKDRICVIMLVHQFPELFSDEDVEKVYTLGNTFGRYLFYSISDSISETYGFISYKDRQQNANKLETSSITLDEALKKISRLENELQETSTMLSELQTEFTEQLNETKYQEITGFFAKLNSEKYGCILDQLLDAQIGLNVLRKKNYKLPPELINVSVVLRNMLQFVKDSNINPVLKPGTEKIAKASEIEAFAYSGTAFNSEEETKTVKVISPGWIYKEKNIQISRPHVKEINK